MISTRPCRIEPAQVGPVLGMGVPVRLEVVDLGEHELVFRVATGHFEVGVHEFEAVGLAGATGRVLGPLAGVRGLGVPPHRVVVEVADHEHRPAGLGVGELERRGGVAGVDRRRAGPAGHPVGDDHRHLDGPIPGRGQHLAGRLQAVADDADRRRCGRPGVGDADDLQRRVVGADEQLRRLRGGHRQRHAPHFARARESAGQHAEASRTDCAAPPRPGHCSATVHTP